MKTLGDLLRLIDAFASPGFELGQAAARLGPVTRWTGASGKIDPVSRALRETFVEMHEGELRGVHSHFAEPVDTSWADLEEQLGPPLDEEWEVDNWDGPPIFLFVRSTPSGPVEVHLGVDRRGDAARIESFVIRTRARSPIADVPPLERKP